MTLRATHPQKTAAAMAGFSSSTGHPAEKDPRLPSERHRARRHGGGKPDPLTGLRDQEIVPHLRSMPGLKPITVLEELQRRHPERDLMLARRTLERRMRLWRAEHGAERDVIFRQTHEPGRQGTSDFFNARKLGPQTGPANWARIAARYERSSIMITANQPFSGWDAVFPDKAMTIAAIARFASGLGAMAPHTNGLER